MDIATLITRQPFNRGDVVYVQTESSSIPYVIVWVTRKTLLLKHIKTKEKKRAYWSEKKCCYSLDNKYSIYS